MTAQIQKLEHPSGTKIQSDNGQNGRSVLPGHVVPLFTVWSVVLIFTRGWHTEWLIYLPTVINT